MTVIAMQDELEMLKAENAALKEELRQMKNYVANKERQWKIYGKEWQKTADKLRELKATLKELAKY